MSICASYNETNLFVISFFSSSNGVLSDPISQHEGRVDFLHEFNSHFITHRVGAVKGYACMILLQPSSPQNTILISFL